MTTEMIELILSETEHIWLPDSSDDEAVYVIADETISRGDMLSMYWDILEETFKARVLTMEDDCVAGIAENSATKGEKVRILTH